MLSELLDAKVEFLMIGGYAMVAHGYYRMTKDLDIWIRATPDNADRLWQALLKFGATLSEVRPEDFLSPAIIFQVGLPPVRVDIVTQIEGVSFEDAWPHRITCTVAGMGVPVIGLDELIANKKTVGRDQDLIDAAWLEKSRNHDKP